MGGVGVIHVYGQGGDYCMSDFRRPGEDPKATFMESPSTELQSDIAPLPQGPGEVHSLRGAVWIQTVGRAVSKLKLNITGQLVSWAGAGSQSQKFLPAEGTSPHLLTPVCPVVNSIFHSSAPTSVRP